MRRWLGLAALLGASCQPADFTSTCRVVLPPVPVTEPCSIFRGSCQSGRSYGLECRDGLCTCLLDGVAGATIPSTGLCGASSAQQDSALARACGFTPP